MPKFFKIFYIILASCLLACGIALISISFAKKVFASEIITKEYDITESFDNIKIDFRTTDINIQLSSDANCKVVCKDKEKEYSDVKVEDNKLIIDNVDNLEWYEKFFNFPFQHTSVTIYLPSKQYSKFDIDGSTGDINISNINVDEIKASSSTGDVILKDVECDILDISTTTGDILLENTIASTKMKIDVTTGDIEFKDSDSKEIVASSTTGDIEGVLLTGKVFSASTTTGSKSVPSDDSTTGGKCSLSTTTGDINIRIKNS